MGDFRENIEAGARNLLLNCAQARPGDRLLLVGEQCDEPFFEAALCDEVARVARELGLEVRTVMAPPVAGASEFPESVASAMMDADLTIFFSRLGDQVRFLETPGPSKKIMAYTLTLEHLASPFAALDCHAMQRLHDMLSDEITRSRRYTIETDSGTSLAAEMRQQGDSATPAITPFTVELFPMMIFPPVNFYRLYGRLELKGFLMSTSTRAYDDSVLLLQTPVFARIEDSRIVGFDGDSGEIDAIEKQLERAAGITGGDPYRVNSWHTGINSYTFFDGDPFASLERWGTVAYGSPRYTHIHAAGDDPGDVSFHLFDATIRFDDRLFWDHGRFVYLDRPEVQALFADKDPAPDSSTIRNIGM